MVSTPSTNTVAVVAPVDECAADSGAGVVYTVITYLSSFSFSEAEFIRYIHRFTIQISEHCWRDSKLFSSSPTSVQPPNFTHFLVILSKKYLIKIITLSGNIFKPFKRSLGLFSLEAVFLKDSVYGFMVL